MRRILCAAAPLLAACFAVPAHADVVISTDATQNITCANGICAPTAASAVLNVTDLENLLASGNVEVTTTGSGVQADNIDIAAPLSWSNASSLSLDAYQSLTFTASMSVAGAGGVTLTTNDGGSGGLLTFLQRGNVTFSDAADSLVINGTPYRLETTLKSLAYDIVRNPTHAFALANDLDEKRHGIFRTPPIPVNFNSTFNGLGHTISNIAIADLSDTSVGFFAVLSAQAIVSSLGLRNVHIITNGNYVGGLVGYTSGGTIMNSWVSGNINGSDNSQAEVGGLVGYFERGTLSNSWSSAKIVGAYAGGLTGGSEGTIQESFATGAVEGTFAGGLVGMQGGPINNSYARGSVTGLGLSDIGGLAGETVNTTIASTYSTGHVGQAATVGGFIGKNSSSNAQFCYWDTSKNIKGLQAVGNGSDAGITGLTTKEFRSGLPSGFDPAIWAQSPTINHGFPYLIANPPPQ